MFTRQPVFAQLMSSLDPAEFTRCAERFPMRRTPRGLSAYDHFLAMVFAHLTHRESLRDLATCLQSKRAYHAGFRSRVTRTNIAYANQHRDWRVFAAVAEVLMRRVRRAYQNQPQTLGHIGKAKPRRSNYTLCCPYAHWLPLGAPLRRAVFQSKSHWILSPSKPEPSTLWIEPIWIFHV
jgi:Domain of unknown function (DUF4372)